MLNIVIYVILIIGDTMQMNVENIVTYFKIKNEKGQMEEYILYHNGVEKTCIHIARVVRENHTTKLVKPTAETLPLLKKIIQNLISVNPNSFIFSQNKYQYIDLYYFNNKQIEQVESQKVQLTDEQYSRMIGCKYLMYPYDNMTKNKAIGGSKYNALADTISIAVSSVLLLLIIGGLIAYHFDFDLLKEGMTNFRSIITETLSFDLYVHNFLILRLAVISLLLAIISYKSEKSNPLVNWFAFVIILLIFYVIWYLSQGYVKLGDGFGTFFKQLSIYTLFTGTIFTIAYTLSKEVATLITTKFSFCNFVTYYTIFFLLFAFSFIGVGLFYNNYLFEHVLKFVAKI